MNKFAVTLFFLVVEGAYAQGSPGAAISALDVDVDTPPYVIPSW